MDNIILLICISGFILFLIIGFAVRLAVTQALDDFKDDLIRDLTDMNNKLKWNLSNH